MTTLPKKYSPRDHEAAIYAKWESSQAFAPSPQSLQAHRRPYVIMLPPPNITGSLHIGHALQDTIIDILIRYHRLLGEPALWVPGTDSAAIATNRVLEQQLAAEGTTSRAIGRAAFLKKADAWYQKTGKEILHQMRRLGCSCDWGRERFTLDEQYIAAVNAAFIRYFKQGYIYRGSRIVNWDPQTQTTVSDLEIERRQEKTPLYTLQYGPFQISTARPETKFGDKYVVVHPQDKRYAQYESGYKFTAAWINGPVQATVVKDEAIDPAFGTGAMTITPWHDVTDFEIAQRHNLDSEQIIGFDGRLLPIAGRFAGQTIAEARPRIVEQLNQNGLLVGVDKSYEHSVALNDRGKGVIEPQIMRQWFVDMSKLKNKAIAAARQDIKFSPARWQKHFISWLENVYDWNINRQIWLGHRLPVWWKVGTHGGDDEEGNYVVSVEKPAGDYEQDPDVLDTWFATALWPFAALGWPEKTVDLKTFYPTSVLVTARDILYLWVARMIFSSLEFVDQIPFQDVFVHPTVLAKDGRRMSKSLGTGVDPLKLIDEYGADATRFGLMYQCSFDSQAIKFDEAAIKSARNFVNKIWNLARLLQSLPDRTEETVADIWIKERLAVTAARVGRLLDLYKVGEAAHVLYDFVWNDFADWYIEIVKVSGTPAVARTVFLDLLKLSHPFLPHITELLWNKFEQPGLLMTSSWPLPTAPAKDKATTLAMARFQDIVSTVRSARSLFAISPAVVINLAVSDPPLPTALATMCRVRLIDAQEPAMKQLPLSSGGTISISSRELTAEAVARAKKKLTRQATNLENKIKRTQTALAGMRGQASRLATAAQEVALTKAQTNLKQVKSSLKLL